MSLDFDGANDSASVASATLGDARSFTFWMRPTSQGESDSGHMIGHGASLRSRISFDGTGGSEKFRFRSNRATDGIWVLTTGLAVLDAWHFVGVTYDGTLTTNDPIFYLAESAGSLVTLTVGAGLTESSTPNGAEAADGDTFIVGIETLAGNGDFDGLIAEVAVWPSRLLSAAEMASVRYNGALSVPGMYLYWPLGHAGTADAKDFSGNARNGTISGAVWGENPPIRPGGRRG